MLSEITKVFSGGSVLIQGLENLRGSKESAAYCHSILCSREVSIEPFHATGYLEPIQMVLLTGTRTATERKLVVTYTAQGIVMTCFYCTVEHRAECEEWYVHFKVMQNHIFSCTVCVYLRIFQCQAV